MRPDPGRDRQEAIIAGMSARQRTEQAVLLRQKGLWMVWKQADAAGITDPLLQADFILRRLYPEMSARWFAGILANLSVLHAAGRWNGFERPE